MTMPPKPDPRLGLIGTYRTNGITVLLHRPGCNALRMTGRRNQHCGAMDAMTLADLDEREFNTVICKCVTDTEDKTP